MPTTPPPDPRFQRLCELVETKLQSEAIPGAAFGIYHQGQATVAGFGVTSVDNPLPVTADTLFQVGSITKTFTATAIMRLVEAGKLSLDTPVRTYLPGLRLADESVAERVTLRHLLTHSGGWEGDYFNDYGPGPEALKRIVEDLAGLPQLTPLGELFSYSNSGWYLAGRLVEIASGKSYEEAMHELIFEPLGLKNCFFFPHQVMTYRFATGHETVDKKAQVARPWWIGRAGHSIGGLVTDIHDLFTYARFHMGDPALPHLLTPQSLKLMQTPRLESSSREWVGLSWFISRSDGHTLLRHSGGTKGQISLLTVAPDANFAFAALTNSDDGDRLTYPLRSAALREYLGIQEPEIRPIEMPAEKLDEVTGTYAATPRETCTFQHRADGLWLKVESKGGFPTPSDPPPLEQPPEVRIAFYGDDRLVGLEAPFKDMRFEILRGQDGKIAFLRIGGRLSKRLEGPSGG